MAFRSEADAVAWAAEQGADIGGTVPVKSLNSLRRGWYGGRLSDDWRPSPVAAKQALFREAGLFGAFWELG